MFLVTSKKRRQVMYANETIKYLLNSEKSFQGSISPTYYVQLLRTQRSQNCKKQLNLTVFLALLGSGRVKDERKMLVKLTPGIKMALFLNEKHLLMMRMSGDKSD